MAFLVLGASQSGRHCEDETGVNDGAPHGDAGSAGFAGPRSARARGVGDRGRAGIGKTTLMISATDVARSQGFSVLSAHGSAAEVDYAFAAVADLLNGIDQAVLGELCGPQRAALDRARDEPTPAEPDIGERAVAAASCAAVERLSARSPALLARRLGAVVDRSQPCDRHTCPKGPSECAMARHQRLSMLAVGPRRKLPR